MMATGRWGIWILVMVFKRLFSEERSPEIIACYDDR